MGEVPPLRPCLRITATYPATDGTMPESIDIMWETEFPPPEVIQAVVETLGRLPVRRHDALAQADPGWARLVPTRWSTYERGIEGRARVIARSADHVE
jgi:hypothetical protein